MTKLTYGYASFVQFEAQGLTIHLSAKLFRIELWEAIRDWFQTKYGVPHWLSAPFRVLTAEEDVPGYPRWKQIEVDGLSWIIFHLLVPPDHRLVQLWQRVDWSAINRLCAPVYKNSESGQRAWAPAQMFALLLLYFVLPVPSECSLLRTVANQRVLWSVIATAWAIVLHRISGWLLDTDINAVMAQDVLLLGLASCVAGVTIDKRVFWLTGVLAVLGLIAAAVPAIAMELVLGAIALCGVMLAALLWHWVRW